MKNYSLAIVTTLTLAVHTYAGDTRIPAILNNALTTGINSLNDNNVERVLDPNGSPKINQVTATIDVGDILESVLIIENISNSVFGATPLANAVGVSGYQLTVHARQTVKTKTSVGGGFFDFDFSPTIFNVYEDSPAIGGTLLVDFSSQSADAAVAAATDGIFILSLDDSGTAAGGADDFLRTIGTDVFGALTSGNQANFIGGLSVINNPGGVSITQDATLSGTIGSIAGSGDLHDVVLVGEAEAASIAVLNRGWGAQSDTTIFFNIVPEPTTFVLCALALFSRCVAYRHRNRY